MNRPEICGILKEEFTALNPFLVDCDVDIVTKMINRVADRLEVKPVIQSEEQLIESAVELGGDFSQINNDDSLIFDSESFEVFITEIVRTVFASGGDYKAGFLKGSKREDEFRNKLEDVVNELDLSKCMIEEHGQHGTPPAELVRLVLEEKDRKIAMLKSGFVDVASSSGEVEKVGEWISVDDRLPESFR